MFMSYHLLSVMNNIFVMAKLFWKILNYNILVRLCPENQAYYKSITKELYVILLTYNGLRYMNVLN